MVVEWSLFSDYHYLNAKINHYFIDFLVVSVDLFSHLALLIYRCELINISKFYGLYNHCI